MKIDPEFRALIPALKPEEKAQLEANLQAHGCRDPLVLWRGILIDGHNRYDICERLNIKYRTVEIVLPSREHVLLWIEENHQDGSTKTWGVTISLMCSYLAGVFISFRGWSSGAHGSGTGGGGLSGTLSRNPGTKAISPNP